MRELISTVKKNKKRTGVEWTVEHSPQILAREEKAEKSQQQGMQIKRVGMFVKNNAPLLIQKSRNLQGKQK